MSLVIPKLLHIPFCFRGPPVTCSFVSYQMSKWPPCAGHYISVFSIQYCRSHKPAVISSFSAHLFRVG